MAVALQPQGRPLQVYTLSDLRNKVRTERNWVAMPSTSDADLIASYNWAEPAEDVRRRQNLTKTAPNPVMVVPGAPQIFSRWKGGLLQPDQELPFADENRFFMNTYPTEPLFRATLLEGHDPLSFQTLDLVTDRFNLRLLFQFCKFRLGYTGEHLSKMLPPRSFKIDIERFGPRMVVFEQKTPVEYPARMVPIYGHAFENACTRPWDNITKGSFYSIIKYNLDHQLSCLVRLNADCVDEWPENGDRCNDGVFFASEEIFGSELKYVRHGYRKYDCGFIELTTKQQESIYPEYLWDQMYFGRISRTYIGWHKDGNCMYPQPLTMAELEYNIRNRLQLLRSAVHAECLLLKNIISFIRSRPDGERYTLVYDSEATPDLVRLYNRSDTFATSPHSGLLPVSLRNILEGK